MSGDFQAQILMDLFLAGGETSATTLAWSVVHMVRHPDVQVLNSTNFFYRCRSHTLKLQVKVQAELDNVLGPDRPPTMQDKLSLPYTEVTLKGLLSSIMPV